MTARTGGAKFGRMLLHDPAAATPAPHRRRIWGVLTAFGLAGALALVPIPALSSQAHTMAAIAVAVVVLWVSEALPLEIPALAGPCVAVLLGVTSAKNALMAFADPLIFLFLGGFLLAQALSDHGFDRRIALWLVSHRRVGGSPLRVTLALGWTTFFLSMWISNTAATAMMLPVALGFSDTLRRAQAADDQKVGPSPAIAAAALDRLAERTYLLLACAASMGGMCTPVGTAPNVIALATLEHLGIRIDFLQWMSFGVPAGMLGMTCACLWISRGFPACTLERAAFDQHLTAMKKELGPMLAAEWRVLALFALAIAGWLTPALFRIALGEAHPLTAQADQVLNEGVVAILVASLLFLLPAGRNRTGRAPQAPLLGDRALSRLDWGTLYLLGGGMALGKLAFDSGLAKAIGDASLGALAAQIASPVVFLAITLAVVIALTEVTSNTALTNMMMPVVAPIAIALGGDPRILVVGVTLAASYGFMFPVSTPPNAIVYGTGAIRLPSMMRFGLAVDACGVLVLTFVGTFLVPWAFSP